ncbi:MAG: glycoside hydrolase family 3 N-terminal domain-containing protein [Planctomycetota bacterium]
MRHVARTCLSMLVTASLSASLTLQAAAQAPGRPDLTQAEWDRVDQLLNQMTVEEKAGQMTQLTLGVLCEQTADGTNKIKLDPAKAREAILEKHIGSVLNAGDVTMTPDEWVSIVTTLQGIATDESRLGVPLIYGIDSVHGANYVTGATIFPHNLNLGASWNPELARASGAIAARDSRAVGLNWNFAPVCDVARIQSWSRVFETFSEDPYLASVMSAAAVEGMQGDDLSDPTALAATAKHFLGYSEPRTGRDRTPAIVSTADLHDTFLPPFKAAFDAGVRTIMINSGEVNGTPVHADQRILTDLLRGELGFEGVAVTDWADVNKLVDFHYVAEDQKEAAFLAVNAGIDMAMTPLDTAFTDHVIELVEEGRLTEDRLDESVRRILALKMELGLFESVMPADAARDAIGSPEAEALSLESARQGITLLRNFGGVLPFADETRILVTGPTADDLVSLHGSWTYAWQGTNADLYPDTPTIFDAMTARFGAANVTHFEGATYDETTDLDAAVEAAEDADVVLLCLGELPSTEMPGNLSDLTISAPQIELATALAETGKPVVLVMVTNRPRVLAPIEAGIPAILWAGHPGPHGSTALAEILAGDVSPSGRLPFTYPRHTNALLTYDHKHTERFAPDNTPTGGFDPLFPFGAGLSYTSFQYDGLTVDVPAVGDTGPEGDVTVSFSLTNTGDRAGVDVLQVYVADNVASVTPRVERLKAFRRVGVAAGESVPVTFSLPPETFTMVDRDGTRFFEPGAFTIRVGDDRETIELRP